MPSATQYHLRGKGFSGRCVRLRVLTGDELDKYFDNTSMLLGKDATMGELLTKHKLYCLKATVIAMTEPNSESPTKNSGWEKVSFEKVQTEFDTLFTAKDREMIGRIYNQNHDPNQAEIADIMGGGIPVETE